MVSLKLWGNGHNLFFLFSFLICFPKLLYVDDILALTFLRTTPPKGSPFFAILTQNTCDIQAPNLSDLCTCHHRYLAKNGCLCFRQIFNRFYRFILPHNADRTG